MNRLSKIFVAVLIFQSPMLPAMAEGGYQMLNSGYQAPSAQNGAFPGLANNGLANSVNAMLDQKLQQVNISSPTDAISFDQLQSIIQKFPGVDKFNIQFPNQASWQTSPSDLLNLNKQFMEQAEGLGFGVGGAGIPQLVFSSIASQAGLDNVPGGVGGLAMVPINNLKSAMGDTLEPVLRQMRYEQLSMSDWIPGWLKDAMLWAYNFVMPYYYSASNWIMSFF